MCFVLVSLLVTVVDSLDAVHSSGLSVVSVVRACVVASYSIGFIGLVQIRSEIQGLFAVVGSFPLV